MVLENTLKYDTLNEYIKRYSGKMMRNELKLILMKLVAKSAMENGSE
jgi:hypothetical protein